MSRSELESESLREIILMTAIPKVERVELSDSTVNIFGEIRYSGIASCVVDEKASYVGIKISSPFATNVNIDCQNVENLQIDAQVLAHSASASIDADKIYASCTLESVVMISEEQRERVLSTFSIKEGDPLDVKGAKITVYYPTSDDTLFSVAKRFRTSVLKVARDNEISESVFSAGNPDGRLSGVKKLVIY